MYVTTRSGQILDVEDQELGAGGVGTVYAVRNADTVVKLFKYPTPDLAQFMARVLETYNCTRDPNPTRANYWNTLYVWPTDLVDKPSLGLVMPRFPAGFRNLKWLFSPKNHQSLPPDCKRWNQRVLITWRLAQAVHRLRMNGLAHSDLSHNNVLADPKTGSVRVIDIDGLVAAEFNPPQVLGTPRYIAPEVMARRALPNVQTDEHALAVLIYQLLLFRHPLIGPHSYGMDLFDADAIELRQLGEEGIYIEHPTDRRNLPKQLRLSAAMLGITIKRLFEQAFVEGLRDPSRRPKAMEWKQALGRLSDRLVTCANVGCDERYFPIVENRPMTCPWCGTPLSVPGGLPILRLYEQGPRETKPVPDFWIAGYPGRTLHSWHFQAGGDADVFANQAALAQVVRHADGTWGLKCLGSEVGVMDARGQVTAVCPPGREAPLQDKAVFRLGPQGGRFALVQWMK